MRKPLAVLIGVVGAIQLFLAHRYYGFLGGDDVEVLEEAFRRAVGLKYQPWSIRNLFVPDVFVAPFVYVGNALGIVDRRLLIDVATLPFIALSLLTIALVYRLAMQWVGDDGAAFVAALVFALHWIPLGFGATVYPRTLATACLVLAALILDRYPFVAGLLVALAFADRFSELMFLAPLLVLCRAAAPAGRPPRAVAIQLLLGTATGVALLGGVYDWITWGTPFSSLRDFARLTVVKPDFASRVKYQPPFWYLANIARWCAPTLVVLMIAGGKRVRWSFIILPLLALSAIKHKEFRYLQAMIPFIAIGAAAGFAWFWHRGRRALAIGLVAISVIWNLAGLRTFQRKTMPAVMAAKAIDGNPSLKTIGVPQAWAFGDLLYFHRDVSLIEIGTPPREIPDVDALALYRTELDDAEVAAAVKRAGYAPQQVFSDPPARVVVLLTRPASGTSDPARR